MFITWNPILFYYFPHNFFTFFAISHFWATVETISMGNHQKHRLSGDKLRAKAGLLQQQHLENRIHQPDAVPSPNMSALSASKNPQCSKMHTDTEYCILISPKLMAQQTWIKGYFQAYRSELKQAAFSSHCLQEEQPQTLHPWTVTAFSSPVCLLPFRIQSILFKSIPSGPHSWIPWISLKCKSSTCKHTTAQAHSAHLPWVSISNITFSQPCNMHLCTPTNTWHHAFYLCTIFFVH